MRILISSHAYAPSLGGIETASQLLSAEFVKLGHEVRVLTQTPASLPEKDPFEVLRKPDWRSVLRSLCWCDVYWQNNVSMRTLWPALFCRRPVFITVQTWIPEIGMSSKLKRMAHRSANTIFISQAIRDSLGGGGAVIPNPFDSAIFTGILPEQRDLDLVFLGRLVSDKGADLLLEALSILQQRRLAPRLTIIGTGPEEANLRRQAEALRLTDQVRFAGALKGSDLACLIARHRILVVPSRWSEPFGIVALEGIASGCVVVGSGKGGLPEAIGPCGRTFPNGDAYALAVELQNLLVNDSLRETLLRHAKRHLAKFEVPHVARQYQSLFEGRIRGCGDLEGSEHHSRLDAESIDSFAK